MGIFWVFAALMIALALVFVLPPMLRRRSDPQLPRKQLNLAIYKERLAELEADVQSGALERDEYQETKAELERGMLEDLNASSESGAGTASASPLPAVIIAIAVPTAAFGLYMELGSPRVLWEGTGAPAAPQQARAGGGQAEGQLPHSVEEMVAQLRARLEAQPDDAEGWLMLARSYIAMNRAQDAREAYAQAYRRDADNPQVLVGYAEVLGRTNENRLAGEPEALVRRALEIAPGYEPALWLSGLAKFQRGDNAGALAAWQELRASDRLSDEQRRTVEEFIARAGGDGTAAAPVAQTTIPAPRTDGAAAGAGPGLSVAVSLAPEVASQAAPEDTVFVFARAAEGPRMPLAIVRKQVKDLPLQVTLDDSMAMMPALKLSNFPQVVVGARVSKSGNATPSPGDLQGLSEPVAPGGAQLVQVSIDQRVP